MQLFSQEAPSDLGFNPGREEAPVAGRALPPPPPRPWPWAATLIGRDPAPASTGDQGGVAAAARPVAPTDERGFGHGQEGHPTSETRQHLRGVVEEGESLWGSSM